MKVKRISLHSVTERDDKSVNQNKEQQNDDGTIHNMAWVIDDALSNEFLDLVQRVRLSLPLDTKRPTVKRRFFSAAKECPEMIEGIREAIQAAMAVKDQTKELQVLVISSTKNVPNVQVHVLSYMRYLEYDEIGGHLDPHTDGNKVCEDTGRRSTHTMLIYLRDCQEGGETILLEGAQKQKAEQQQKQQSVPRQVIEAVAPQKGRILLFPHPIWHEGAPIKDVPKICLRAEVCLFRQEESG